MDSCVGPIELGRGGYIGPRLGGRELDLGGLSLESLLWPGGDRWPDGMLCLFSGGVI